MDTYRPQTGQNRILKTKQDFKNQTEYVQTTTFKKKIYMKLPNTYTTILKNIVASKVAAGPLNTFKNKIINILTPQAEFVAANTKIK